LYERHHSASASFERNAGLVEGKEVGVEEGKDE